MISIEKNGKTVEDAVQAGLKELGKSSSEVTIDVLEYGSPGLFGMFGKLAKVRLTVKEADPDLDFEMPVFSLDQQASKPAKAQPRKQDAPKPEEKPQAAKPEPRPEPRPEPKPEIQPEPRPEPQSTREPAREKPQADRALVDRQVRPAKPRKPRPELPPREPRPAEPALTMEDLPELDLNALSEDGKGAYEFLRELTKLMNVDVEIRIRESEGHMQVQMIGDTLGVLIGRRGETLDALQYLASLQVNKGRDEYLRVTLDTEHYRAKREEALKRLADRMASRARRTGHRVALEPMNPYERRVLHSALQDNPYVTTHSEGEEPYRRVVITLK